MDNSGLIRQQRSHMEALMDMSWHQRWVGLRAAMVAFDAPCVIILDKLLFYVYDHHFALHVMFKFKFDYNFLNMD